MAKKILTRVSSKSLLRAMSAARFCSTRCALLRIAAICSKAHFMSHAVLATRKDIEAWKQEQIQLRLIAQRAGDEDELKRLDHNKELQLERPASNFHSLATDFDHKSQISQHFTYS